ncbi:MAG: tetratricopeptide repeat protein [Mariniblastus sp.]
MKLGVVSDDKAAKNGDESPISEQKILDAIQQLSSEVYSEREAAEILLWKAGDAAEPHLRAMLLNPSDPETAKHCHRIIERFELGIHPDTPPETIALIRGFKAADINAKMGIANIMLREKKLSQVIRLIQTVSLNDRQRLDPMVMHSIEPMIFEALAKENFKLAEELLLYASQVDPTRNEYSSFARDYAVFIALTGSVEDQIEVQKLNPSRVYRNSANRILANLMVVKGDLANARSFAEKIIPLPRYRNLVLTDIYLRQKNWQAITQDESIMKRISKSTIQVGLKAAFYRRANEIQKFEREIDEVRQTLIDSPRMAFYCTEAFLINHKWQDAVQTAKLYSYPIAFDLLCHRSEFKEAFELIKFDFSNEDTAASEWLRKMDQKFELGTDNKYDEDNQNDNPEKQAKWITEIFPPKGIDAKYVTDTIAGKLAWQLHHFGQVKQAKLLLEEMERTSTPDLPKRIVTFIETSYRCGYEDWATEAANKEIKIAKSYRARQSLLRPFFPDQSLLAVDLAELAIVEPELFGIDLDSANPKFIQQIKKIISPVESEILSLPDLKKILAVHDERFYKRARRQTTKNTILKNQAKLATIHEHSEKAKSLLLASSVSSPSSSDVHLRLGDWFRENEQWSQAAKFYRTSFQCAKPSDKARYVGEMALAAYLEGYVLRKSGKLEEGDARIKLAVLLPLSRSNARQQLAAGLEMRGLTKAADKNFVDTYKYSMLDLNDWWLHRAASSAGNALKRTDGAMAANVWELSVLHLTNNTSKYNDILAYPRELMLVHERRGLELKKAGKLELAVKEFEKCVAIGNIGSNPHISLISTLEELGRTEAAEQQFQKSFEHYSKTLELFPNSSHHNNNLAWLCVRLNRKIDLAEKLAQKALASSPDDGDFLDTTAAIHAAKGNIEKAIEFQIKAVATDESNMGFKVRLKEFKSKLDEQKTDSIDVSKDAK